MKFPPADLRPRLVPLPTHSHTQCRRVAVPSVRNVSYVCISYGLGRNVGQSHDVYLQENETKSKARRRRRRRSRLEIPESLRSRPDHLQLRGSPWCACAGRPRSEQQTAPISFSFPQSCHIDTRPPLPLKRNQRPLPWGWGLLCCLKPG